MNIKPTGKKKKKKKKIKNKKLHEVRSKNIRTCSSIFFLNQEINPATTSNPESKSKPKIKEHEHQTYREKKHEDHQIKEHEQKQTLENED